MSLANLAVKPTVTVCGECRKTKNAILGSLDEAETEQRCSA